MLTAQQTINIKNRANVRNQIVLGPKSLKLIGIIFFGILMLLYLAQTTQGAPTKYQTNELEDQKEELVTQKEQLDVEAARLQSLQKVEEGAKNNNMVPVKEIESLEAQK